jgi:hypothetical protein
MLSNSPLLKYHFNFHHHEIPPASSLNTTSHAISVPPSATMEQSSKDNGTLSNASPVLQFAQVPSYLDSKDSKDFIEEA